MKDASERAVNKQINQSQDLRLFLTAGSGCPKGLTIKGLLPLERTIE